VLDRETTVILNELGMVDTPTLQHLTRAITESGAKLIAVGDGRQLPAIGPSGMFRYLATNGPRAELEHVHRTKDPEEQRAWRALRDGKPDRAMAHYLAGDQLHLTDHRDEALHAAVDRYHDLALRHGHEHVALMSDGAGHEIDRMNAAPNTSACRPASSAATPSPSPTPAATRRSPTTCGRATWSPGARSSASPTAPGSRTAAAAPSPTPTSFDP
jgi:hypothetical protein